MKSLFISFNQAHYEDILEALEKTNIKGYTSWEEVKGKGSYGGEPHLGNHTWPTLNSSILTILDDDKLQPLLERLKALNDSNPKQGLRAFYWNIEGSI
ncbi:MAG: hypothetical protein R3Y50_01665 [Rikenellaceae bacterium]